MAKFSGELTMDEDGIISMKMRIAPGNPELYDIPLEELFEDYMGKRVRMEIFPIQSRNKSE